VRNSACSALPEQIRRPRPDRAARRWRRPCWTRWRRPRPPRRPCASSPRWTRRTCGGRPPSPPPGARARPAPARASVVHQQALAALADGLARPDRAAATRFLTCKPHIRCTHALTAAAHTPTPGRPTVEHILELRSRAAGKAALPPVQGHQCRRWRAGTRPARRCRRWTACRTRSRTARTRCRTPPQAAPPTCAPRQKISHVRPAAACCHC